MRSTLCAVLLAVSFLMPGNVEARDSEYKYRAYTITCADWTNSNPAGPYPGGTNAKLNWLSGYKTAVNFLAKGKRNFFKGTDIVALKLYIDKHCKQRPQESVHNALEWLLAELNVKEIF
jgi:hypothetical protein